MYKDIEEEKEQEGKEYSEDCIDEEVLNLRRKIKWEEIMEQTKKKQITVGYNYVKINFYSLNISSLQ